MKKILILVDKEGPRKKFLARYLSKNLKNTKVFLKAFRDIFIEVKENKVSIRAGNLRVDSVDLVYFLKVGKTYMQLASTVAYFLKLNKVAFIDQSLSEIGAAGNKLNSIVRLALSGLSVVPSFYVGREKLLSYSRTVVKKYGFPIFVKNLCKQRREGLFFVEEFSDFKRVLDKDEGEGFLLQKSVDVDKEYRLVVMGGKIIGVHQEAERKVKNNRILVDSSESKTGWVRISVVSREMRKAVLAGTRVLGLNISGGDACIERETGKVYIFEINRGPGFTFDTSISPELPELAKYLQNLCK